MLMLSIACSRANDGGYLFVTFKGESPNGEQIYFALSRDGRNWSALNNSKPVLVSEAGSGGVRDPFILRMEGGKKFVLLATDLSIYKKRLETGSGPEAWKQAVEAGGRSLAVWESTDLVNWEGPRLVPVATEDAGCAWAPEAIYDSEANDYLVFWASTNSADKFKKHRIWACRTKDFKTFGEPFIYIEKPKTVIDTTIVHDNGVYYRFSKERESNAIVMESGPKLSGPWVKADDFSLRDVHGIEGPECYQAGAQSGQARKTWCLIADHYLEGSGYHAYVTEDLSKGDFKPDEGFTSPFRFRHGAVLPVSEEEYRKLSESFNKGS